jgi:RNA polymerase-interacting CarD/CdnL/TRCF family regulator
MLKKLKKLLKGDKKMKKGSKVVHHEFGNGKVTKILERESMMGPLRFLVIKFDTANIVINEEHLKSAKIETK